MMESRVSMRDLRLILFESNWTRTTSLGREHARQQQETSCFTLKALHFPLPTIIVSSHLTRSKSRTSHLRKHLTLHILLKVVWTERAQVNDPCPLSSNFSSILKKSYGRMGETRRALRPSPYRIASPRQGEERGSPCLLRPFSPPS